MTMGKVEFLTQLGALEAELLARLKGVGDRAKRKGKQARKLRLARVRCVIWRLRMVKRLTASEADWWDNSRSCRGS